MPNVCRLQLLKCEDLKLFFVRMFSFGQDILKRHIGLEEIITDVFHNFNQLIEEIILRLIDNENVDCSPTSSTLVLTSE